MAQIRQLYRNYKANQLTIRLPPIACRYKWISHYILLQTSLLRIHNCSKIFNFICIKDQVQLAAIVSILAWLLLILLVCTLTGFTYFLTKMSLLRLFEFYWFSIQIKLLNWLHFFIFFTILNQFVNIRLDRSNCVYFFLNLRFYL